MPELMGVESSLPETSLLLEQYAYLCIKGSYSVGTSCANSCVKIAPKLADLLSQFRDFSYQEGDGGEGGRGDHCEGKKEDMLTVGGFVVCTQVLQELGGLLRGLRHQDLPILLQVALRLSHTPHKTQSPSGQHSPPPKMW